MKEKWKVILFILFFLFAIFSSYLIFETAAHYNWDNSLNLVASQFLKGHISLEPDKTLPVGDISIFGGKYYLYFGPLASILLIPFVAIFGINFPQVMVGILSLIVSFGAIYYISRKFNFTKIDSLWLSLFFVVSTVMLSNSLINISSYLVEALGVPLVLISLAFYFSKKKSPFLIGLFMSLAIMTRLTLIFALTFFVIEFIKKRLNKKDLIKLLIPVVFACIILGIYNFLRFNNLFETGYNYHMGDPYPLSKNFEGYGRTNIIHLPANLYAFFLKPPLPILEYKDGFVFRFPYLKADPWGIAIWITSPLFLYLIFKFRKNKYTISALASFIVIAIPIFTYYSIGFAQFGYRYALDFLPFLFLLLIPSLLPRLTKTAITLIIIGVIFNCIYITSLWNVYPHFGIYK